MEGGQTPPSPRDMVEGNEETGSQVGEGRALQAEESRYQGGRPWWV